MPKLDVSLGDRSYPIFIEEGILGKFGRDLKNRNIGHKFCVIADDKVAGIYGDKVMSSLSDSGIEADLITFPEGEKSKSLSVFAELSSQLAKKKFNRKDGLIALGGGVAGDLTGFLAATFMRGVSFVQVPTSLLAQVDSSVGGKTGVDIPEGKNLVGSFYQPQVVYIDPTVLETLAHEHLLGGLAEVIKYGVIRDRAFFKFLSDNRKNILALESEVIEKTILTCCQIKADVVAEDEKEGNVRRILNYGHTIGHAIEAASDYSLIHGLAVSIGMAAAARLSVANNTLDHNDAKEVIDLLKQFTLPTEIPDSYETDEILEYMTMDKKCEAGKVIFVLPTSIGTTTITGDVNEEHIEKVIGERG